MSNVNTLLDSFGKLAQAGVSSLVRAQQTEQQVKQHKKSSKGCTPCAAKAAVAAARARIAQGKL